jgi:hypothetical protein
MAHFEATIRVFDVIEANGPAARRAVEQRLRSAGFTRWQIVGVGVQGAAARGAGHARRAVSTDLTYAGGGLLVAAVVAWTLWFLWLLAG